MELKPNLKMKGQLRLRVYENDSLVSETIIENLMCNAGMAVLASAMMWSCMQDQNANMGTPFSPIYCTPAYVAVGSGDTSPTVNDTQLTTELGRVTIASSGYASDAFVLLGVFPAPASEWTVAEAGLFLQASSTANSGYLLDHALVSPTVTVTTSQTLSAQVTFTIS